MFPRPFLLTTFSVLLTVLWKRDHPNWNEVSWRATLCLGYKRYKSTFELNNQRLRLCMIRKERYLVCSQVLCLHACVYQLLQCFHKHTERLRHIHPRYMFFVALRRVTHRYQCQEHIMDTMIKSEQPLGQLLCSSIQEHETPTEWNIPSCVLPPILFSLHLSQREGHRLSVFELCPDRLTLLSLEEVTHQGQTTHL